MKTALESIPCFARQAAEAVTQTVSEPDRREKILRTLLRAISPAKPKVAAVRSMVAMEPLHS